MRQHERHNAPEREGEGASARHAVATIESDIRDAGAFVLPISLLQEANDFDTAGGQKLGDGERVSGKCETEKERRRRESMEILRRKQGTGNFEGFATEALGAKGQAVSLASRGFNQDVNRQRLKVQIFQTESGMLSSVFNPSEVVNRRIVAMTNTTTNTARTPQTTRKTW